VGLLNTIRRWAPVGAIPEIEARVLEPKIGGPLIIDVRTALEHRASRIRGALSLPIHRFSVAELSVDDREREIVIICLTAHRSVPVVRMLRDHGYENAVQLRGGMRAWWKAGLPTESG